MISLVLSKPAGKTGVSRLLCVILVASSLVLMTLVSVQAAGVVWNTDGIPVCTSDSSDTNCQLTGDGSGGAIITWLRGTEVFAQRVDSNGNAMWTTDGVPVCTAPGGQQWPGIVTDGSGGAIITWQDWRPGPTGIDIYAQRVDPNGNTMWAANGVRVCAAPDDQYSPQIIADGSGGAIITWSDWRSTEPFDIYAQRLDSNGNRKWTANGVAICTSTEANSPAIASDGSGGAIVTWVAGSNVDIFAQKVDSAGNTKWAANGVAVSTLYGNDESPLIVHDGSGGAVIAWQYSHQLNDDYDVYAQKVDSGGNKRWAANGVAVCKGPDVDDTAMTSDGSGGAIITWDDNRSGNDDLNIYAQKVNSNGNTEWQSNGIAVCTAPLTQYLPAITTDGAGGAIITWAHAPDDWVLWYLDIYAQRVLAGGTVDPSWPANGLGVSTTPDDLQWYPAITPDGSGGAIIAWEDGRNEPLNPTPSFDIYAQRVSSSAGSFYLAEGYTGTNFQEYLCIGNGSEASIAADATADVTFMFTDGTTQTETYNVPASSRFTVDVNSTVGSDREVSVRVESDCPEMVVERPMYFNYNGIYPGGHDAVAASSPNDTWYFAEGTTLAGFDEYITVQNPNAVQANLTFSYMVENEGETVVTGTVGANSRATFRARDQVGDGKNGVSLKLVSDQQVVAERPMYFDYSGLASHDWKGGHCVVGTNSPSDTWYFAEGTTRGNFEQWLCMQNPSNQQITVNATYVLGEGQGEPINKTYDIPAQQRKTISVNQEVGAGKDVSTTLTCDTDFIAERPLYFNYNGQWPGGHDVLGANSYADTWFFAEGYTGENFQEWLCIMNPSGEEVPVTITYYPEGGAPIVKPHTLDPNSRYTVDVNADAGFDLAISAKVEASLPVVVERPMYFNFNGEWPGGHDVLGFTPG